MNGTASNELHLPIAFLRDKKMISGCEAWKVVSAHVPIVGNTPKNAAKKPTKEARKKMPQGCDACRGASPSASMRASQLFKVCWPNGPDRSALEACLRGLEFGQASHQHIQDEWLHSHQPTVLPSENPSEMITFTSETNIVNRFEVAPIPIVG